MRGFINAVLGKTNKDEGFTLIELLMVIGIIVALAAITVPLVTRFAGKGARRRRTARSHPIRFQSPL